MRFLRHPGRVLALLGVSALGACTGDIAELPSNIDEPPPPIEEFCQGLERTVGRTTVHRLNAAEYDRSMRALLLLEADAEPSVDFPVDNESASGFLNDADVLQTGALLILKHSDAARQLAEGALANEAFRVRYLTCAGESCAEQFIRDFGLHAWRRPLVDAEVQRLRGVYEAAQPTLEEEEGLSDEGVQLAIRAMLLSPNTIFRSETHAGGLRDLDSYEIASRLSFFLWSAAPDDELYALAELGMLNREDALRDQIGRMIDDERFQGFHNGFLHRWLLTQKLESHAVNTDAFPEWNDSLRALMLQETELFVEDIIHNELPLSTLVSADFTYLNEELAAHYGIEGVSGPEMRRVVVGARRGAGVLSQGGFLTVSSHPRVTSPVTRGFDILSRLLCAPPPAAPANVDPNVEPVSGQSRRQALEAHRSNQECAVCHRAMDPIGFALENYDPTGRWRDTEDGTEDGFAVDATGVLPSGEALDGPQSLGLAIANDERFPGCVVGQLMEYSIGRQLDRADECHVIDVVDAAGGTDATLRGIIEELVLNQVFRQVGGREEASP